MNLKNITTRYLVKLAKISAQEIIVELVAQANLAQAIQDIISGTKKPERKEIYKSYLTVLRYKKDLNAIKRALENQKKSDPELKANPIQIKHLQQVIGNFKNIMRGLDNLKLYHVIYSEKNGDESVIGTVSNNQGKNIKTTNETLEITGSEGSYTFKPKNPMEYKEFTQAVLEHIKNSGLLAEEYR